LKALVPQTNVAKVGVQQLDIGELNIGPASIGKLVLDSVRVGVSTGSVKMRDLRVTISLAMSLDWKVSVTIDLPGPWDPDFTWDGTISFGTQSITVPFGDVNLPGLGTLTLDVPNVTAHNLTAAFGAIRDLRLGPLLAEEIRANNLVAPPPGFQVTGIGLGRLGLDDVMVPSSTLSDVEIGHVHGEQLPLGVVRIPNFELPQASLGQISSQGVDVNAVSRPFEFVADAGVLEITLRLTPGARTRIGELHLNDVRSTTSIGSIELQDVTLPYDVLDLKLSQLGIETIEVPKIEVS
jgi:hypothetical protein